MIDLYFWPTPNGWKASIALEEMELPYTTHLINIGKGDQHTPEFLAISHGDEGIKVSVLCPQGVNTAMAPRSLGDGQTDGIIEADDLASVVVDALREERFHVLPHPEVATYVRRKGEDIDRWLRGMRRLRRQSMDG